MAESWASEDEAEAHCSCFCEKNALIIELAAAARTNYTFGLVVIIYFLCVTLLRYYVSYVLHLYLPRYVHM